MVPDMKTILPPEEFAAAVLSRTLTDAEFKDSAPAFVASWWWVGQPEWEREVGEWAERGMVHLPRALRPSLAALRLYVRELICRLPAAADRALALLLACQTGEELANRAAFEHNGVGLTKFDADWATRRPSMKHSGNRRRLTKYAGQIVRLSDRAVLTRSWRRARRIRHLPLLTHATA